MLDRVYNTYGCSGTMSEKALRIYLECVLSNVGSFLLALYSPLLPPFPLCSSLSSTLLLCYALSPSSLLVSAFSALLCPDLILNVPSSQSIILLNHVVYKVLARCLAH